MKDAVFAAIVLASVCFAAGGQRSAIADEVMKIDDEFRVSKLKKDTAALGRIPADNFCETNQNGNTRDKTQYIELFTSFPIASLTTDSADVRIADNQFIWI
jgi:hypothetical protein